MSNRHNPDEPTTHDTFAGFRRIKPAATVKQGFGQIVVIPEIPVNGTTQVRAFEHKQDAADWVENNLPGQVIAWEVRP